MGIVQKVWLEDHGQDFQSFDVSHEGTIHNANLQGWLWEGRQVKLPLKKNSLVQFLPSGDVLKYRVARVKNIAAVL